MMNSVLQIAAGTIIFATPDCPTPQGTTIQPIITKATLQNQSPELKSKAEKVVLREEVLDLKGAPKKYQKLILENSKIKISVLPELGGKVYEFVSKQSGNNQFYNNSIWKRVKDWGVNSARSDGNWLPIGGIEYSFPTEEHGSVYDHPVTPKIVDNSDGGKSVEFNFPPSKDTKGLSLTVRLTMNPGQDYFEIHSLIENPKGNKSQKYQYWINAMLNPGGVDPREADLKLIFPESMTRVATHWPNKLGPDARTEYEWPKQFENFDSWKDGVVGFFTVAPMPYVAIVSAKNHEGVIRINKAPSYEKIWNFGPPLDYSMFSDTNRVYVENWSGISNNFWTDSEIREGEKVEATEYWMPAIISETDSAAIRKQIQAQIQKSFPAILKHAIKVRPGPPT